jgi:hypothetical protein
MAAAAAEKKNQENTKKNLLYDGERLRLRGRRAVESSCRRTYARSKGFLNSLSSNLRMASCTAQHSTAGSAQRRRQRPNAETDRVQSVPFGTHDRGTHDRALGTLPGFYLQVLVRVELYYADRPVAVPEDVGVRRAYDAPKVVLEGKQRLARFIQRGTGMQPSRVSMSKRS